jgi:outer membrane protein TolC
MLVRACSWGIFAALLSATAYVRAAEPLELKEAIGRSREKNETAGIARARLERARALRRQAISALFPTLTAQGTYTRRANETTREVEGATIVLQKEDALSGQLTLEVDILDARALAGLPVAAHGLDAQSFESRELERRLTFEVAQSYFAVLSAESVDGAASERLSAAKATVEEARSRFEAGLAAKNEVTRTELELASAELARTNARTGVDRSRLALSYLIDEPIEGRPLVEPPQEALPPLDANVLAEIGRAERPDYLALLERAEQAAALAREPLLRLIPTIGARGTVFASNETGFTGRTVDANLAFIATWTLFDGGTRYAERDARWAEHEEARLRAEQLRREIALDVRSALLDLEAARAALDQAEVQARVAQQNAEEVRAMFSSGLASALEQVDAAVSAFEAQSVLARQKVGRRVAELSLLRALGRNPQGGS